MNLTHTVATATLLVFMSSCAPASKPQSVEYYEQHKEERELKLAECASDPGSLRDDPSCINAQRAGSNEGWGSLRSLPPLDWSEQGGNVSSSDASASSTDRARQ